MTCSTLFGIFSLIVLTRASYPPMKSRIVGGQFSEIKKFPHSLYLFTMCGKFNFMCGASIVNQLVILTAGHCVHIPSLVKSCNVNVMAGHEELKKVRISRRTKRILLHEEFSVKEMVNDIALAYLDEKLPLGPSIQRVIITTYTPNVRRLFVAGWGGTGGNEPSAGWSKQLKSVKQYLIPREECSQVVGSGFHFHQGMLCAAYGANDRSAKGDSGSALVSSNGHQVGVTSFGLINDRRGMTVYMNTSYYYNWILTTAEKLHCSY